MDKKTIVKKISGMFVLGTLAISVLLPTQAAVTRASTVLYNKGYLEQNDNVKRAVTQGGRAYDDRGYPLRARLVAGLYIPGNSEHYYEYNVFSGSTSGSAATRYKENVTRGIHGCETY